VNGSGVTTSETPAAETPAPAVPKARTALRWGVRAALVAVAAGMLAVTVALISGHLRLMTVETGSMGDAAPAGSLVVMSPATAADHRVGDIIAYRRDDDSTVVHRVTGRSADGTLTTRGDANITADTPLRAERATWQVLAVAPGGGELTGLVTSPAGLVTLSAVGALGMALVLWPTGDTSRSRFRRG
jgi:signal peptidase I